MRFAHLMTVATDAPIDSANTGNVGLLPRGRASFLPDPGLQPIFCPFVSVDDHALEPPDLFSARLSRGLIDRAPRLVEDDAGAQYWLIDGTRVPILMANGAMGRPKGEWGPRPQRYEDFRRAVWDPDERVADMDVIGMWASLNFASIVFGFAGSRFAAMPDSDLGLACLQAHNDWMLEQWCGSHPERFVPCQLPWLADPVVAAQEIRRNAARGFKAVSFSEDPEGQGLPSIHTRHWDPFLAACEETGTVLNLHVGSSGKVARLSSGAPPDAISVLFPVSGITAVVDWTYSRIPLRYPGLRIVMSEAGVSWVPMLLERMERTVEKKPQSRYWTADDPSITEIVARTFRFTSINDPSAFRQLDIIGRTNVMLECDFPHFDSTWPDTQQLFESEIAHLDDETIQLLCYGNACETYRLAPPPEDRLAASTIGAAMRKATT
jgi:predicted TIM-barrel fold metal-dependent hydrolase